MADMTVNGVIVTSEQQAAACEWALEKGSFKLAELISRLQYLGVPYAAANRAADRLAKRWKRKNLFRFVYNEWKRP